MRRLPTSLQYEDHSRKLVLFASWLCVVVMSISAGQIVRAMGGIAAIGTDEFTRVYGSGLVGHLFAITQLLLVFWIGSLRRLRAVDVLTLFALLSVNVLYQGKGALMVPVVGGLIYRLLTGRLRLTWRSTLFIGAIGYVMFNIVYLVTFSASDPAAVFSGEAYSELFYHFWTFLFAGVLGFGELVRNSVELTAPPSYLAEPFFNLLFYLSRGNLLTGGVTGYELILINPIYGKVTNVITLFGVMQAALGNFGTLLAATLMGAAYYILFMITVRTRNCWLIVAYSFLGAVLSFGWFSYFFSLLTYLEIPVFSLILAMVVAFGGRRRRAFAAKTDAISVRDSL